MRYPTLREEKKLWRQGYKRVACLDEAGVGPLAGPVVAAAVYLNYKGFDLGFKISKIRDSKKLSAKKREIFYKLITKNRNIKWGIGIVSEKIIDKINVLEATKIAMGKALKNLRQKPNFLILDGRLKLNLKTKQKSIIKADTKVLSCAMASILAKVTRDKLMDKYHASYSHYNFIKNKGYPTKFHFKMLKKYGICRIHRKSFRLIREN
ncbi:ribonuclease HII [Patescibacteria group bacterium]